jgi:hypothetical protein
VELASSGGRAFIRVHFVDDYPNISDRDFRLDVYFDLNRRKQGGSMVTLEGTLENPGEDVYDGDDIDLSEGPVVTAEENIRDAEAYIGHDMYLHTRFYKGRSYYAMADDRLSEDDFDLLSEHPEVLYVYTVKTDNIQSNARISFDKSRKYYVYDGDFEYLGTTSAEVPLRAKYYLTDRQVDFNYVTGIEPDPDPLPPPPVQAPPPVELPGYSPNSPSSGGGTGGAATPGSLNPGGSPSGWGTNPEAPPAIGGGDEDSDLSGEWYYTPGWNKNFHPPTGK